MPRTAALHLKVAMTRFLAGDGLALSGYLAFVGLLSLFPFLIFCTALAGFLGSSEFGTYVVAFIFENLADDLHIAVAEIFQEEQGELLAISLLTTVWMAASGIEGIRTALDRAHRLRSHRSYWRRRSQSLGLVIAISVLVVAAETGLVLGPLLWQMFGDLVPGSAPVSWPAGTIQLILGAAVSFVVTCVLYRFLPARAPHWRGVWPGAVLALALWSIALGGFSIYAANVDTYQTIYGGLGGIVLLLVLFYVLAAIFIFCSEVNVAIIEGASRSQSST